MNILPVNSIITSKNPYFSSLDFKMYEYKDCNGKFRLSQCTTAKRKDLNYDNLARIIKNNFKNFNTVNIMPMNISDGTGLYFLSHSLIKELGCSDFFKRCTPIVASDVYAPVISNYPMRGVVFLHPEEEAELTKCNLKLLNKTDISKYKNNIFCDINDYKSLYKLTPEFRKCFDFKIMDLQRRLNTLQDVGNSVVIIRNCLYHSFGENGAVKIAEQVANKLKGKSIFVIGGYDRKKMPDKFMKTINNYFEEIDKNIFQKKIRSLI